MGFPYYGSNPAVVIGRIFAALMRTFGTFGAVLQILCYVFTSLALYTIAKRRGIRNYGLAWVPVANLWILGSISDQYKYVTAGKVQGRRKLLLGLGIVNALSSVLAVSVAVAVVMNALTASSIENWLIGLAWALGAVALLILLVDIIFIVLYFISLYNVYASCMPGNATLFLVLSIFFSVTTPFFLFACREKDDGMPPRYASAPEQNPTYTEPKEPWDI